MSIVLQMEEVVISKNFVSVGLTFERRGRAAWKDPYRLMYYVYMIGGLT